MSDGRQWTHKVVKMAHGIDGQWFDFHRCATFDSETEAMEYAKAFADEQTDAGVTGAKVRVQTRKGNLRIAHFRIGKP